MVPRYRNAYIIAVDMGYGHQRAAFPLLDIATTPDEWNISGPSIISANRYPNIPKKDQQRWADTQKTYEFISRMNGVPFVGSLMFDLMDYFQRIEAFYPKRDLSAPSFQTKTLYRMIAAGFGKHLIETLNKNPIPLLTTFFITAFFAEEHGYQGPIYCLCTDSDISRAWAPLNPQKSRIHYLAPNKRVKERLLMYGVKESNITVTGFPLPKEVLGSEKNLEITRSSLGCRISKLDPLRKYEAKYEKVMKAYLGAPYCNISSDHPLTLTFAVGGAGAQAKIGIEILKSLSGKIKNREIRLALIAGSSKKVLNIFDRAIKELGLDHYRDSQIIVLYDENKFVYFRKFNELLKQTDILWTKPSELSFYAGLGLPIIIAPPLGSQEVFNQAWIHSLGAGVEQQDPRYTDEWLFEWIRSGWLAKAAMSGFLEAPKRGAYRIEELVLQNKVSEIESIHLI